MKNESQLEIILKQSSPNNLKYIISTVLPQSNTDNKSKSKREKDNNSRP